LWLNGADHVTGGSTGRPIVPLGPFGASDETQPFAAGLEQRGHALSEARAILGLIEDVEAATIKYQVKGTFGKRVAEKIHNREMTIARCCVGFYMSSFYCGRRDIYTKHRKALASLDFHGALIS